jgi:SOS-response transcriptional repressor LexA
MAARAELAMSPQRVSTLKTVAEAFAAWVREEGSRAGETASENIGALLRELGFISRDEYDELALRVAQLEHRLRLLEAAGAAPAAPPIAPATDARPEADLPPTPTP